MPPTRYQTRQCLACSERHLGTSATMATRESDAAVGVQLGKVVRPGVGLETDRTAAQQVRHDRDEQLGR